MLEHPGVLPASVKNYFSQDDIQHVDGKTLGYAEFINPEKTHKSRVEDIKVGFENLIEEGNKVSSVHIVEAMRDQQPIKMKVIALFEFKNDKIILYDGLTYMLLGEEKDRTLGSD